MPVVGATQGEHEKLNEMLQYTLALLVQLWTQQQASVPHTCDVRSATSLIHSHNHL
jgi:hypothetical protein